MSNNKCKDYVTRFCLLFYPPLRAIAGSRLVGRKNRRIGTSKQCGEIRETVEKELREHQKLRAWKNVLKSRAPLLPDVNISLFYCMYIHKQILIHPEPPTLQRAWHCTNVACRATSSSGSSAASQRSPHTGQTGNAEPSTWW